MDFLSADSLPWLHESRGWLRDSLLAGRLPHAAMVLSTPGLGAPQLANWMAALALCESPAPRPCGLCASCSLLGSDSHPDFHPVRLEDKATQIKVEQIRELIETLALKSYRGGYKVAIVEEAELLNANGANALLKTLEEPGANTLIILIARPAHRLPATIVSRCLRLNLRPPPRDAAIAWLEAQGRSARNWEAALELAGGAPLRALEFDDAGIADLETRMQDSVGALTAGAVDVTLVADAWVRSDLDLRLIWLENWITRQIHKYQARLPAAALKPKMRALFELLDAAREMRRLASTTMNRQLALEVLLLGMGVIAKSK